MLGMAAISRQCRSRQKHGGELVTALLQLQMVCCVRLTQNVSRSSRHTFQRVSSSSSMCSPARLSSACTFSTSPLLAYATVSSVTCAGLGHVSAEPSIDRQAHDVPYDPARDALAEEI